MESLRTSPVEVFEIVDYLKKEGNHHLPNNIVFGNEGEALPHTLDRSTFIVLLVFVKEQNQQERYLLIIIDHLRGDYFTKEPTSLQPKLEPLVWS